ncbi:1-aminocyclopropane-1-carboxylate deaminase/D-cysteine desulfhydrase [Salinimicrobium terrae]|uniref:1-aminocyclopropane-1-carboxylate deaminase/D-cysteine desulfhydrase n=1 Tax=Salinimicrobium terrae TaxID=470866 RepID=UPI00041F27D3|nr:pyridoxal-phosphate dependent enzyme [Salinimicrobium terrae]
MSDIKNLYTAPPQIPSQFITEIEGVSIFMKREDLLHPEVSGNKFRKLKYNIAEATSQKRQILLTFGGAFSNHIAATAAAGKLSGFKTIGLIRGEELGEDLEKTLQENSTLRFASHCGMKLHFINRSDYRNKTSEAFLEDLRKKFGDFYLVPEGGTNELAVKGCEEILTPEDAEYDTICCAIGTGGTISGLINSSEEHQQILGFPALKGDFLKPEIQRFSKKNNWKIIPDYHFGGYAKVDEKLIEFMNNFRSKYGIQLDPVYTAKLMYGIFDLAETGYFLKNTRILAIHTGGLQGISGMNKVLKMRNLPPILTYDESCN